MRHGRRNVEGWRILDGDQRQAVGRRRNATCSPVAPVKNLTRPGHYLLADADRRKHAGDIAHHMLQEGVCCHLQREPVATAANAYLPEITDRRRRLATGGAKRGEIVAAKQLLCSGVHALRVEWLINPPRAVTMQGGSMQPIQNAVSIAAGGGGEAGMKVIDDRFCPRDIDVVRQVAVGAQQPPALRALAAGFEMNDLARGVHPGVGATGTNHFYGFIGNNRQRLFQTLLHTDTGLLALPPVVPGAVVFDAERDANVRDSLAGKRVEQVLRLLALAIVTFVQHLFENAACASGIAHIDVSARQVELGAHLGHRACLV